jgi:hypothetical protein
MSDDAPVRALTGATPPLLGDVAGSPVEADLVMMLTSVRIR